MEKIKKIIPWVFSLFMFLCFVALRPFGISNLLLLSAGLSIMPPVVRWINKRKKYGGKIKWCVFIILFVLSIFTYQGNANVGSKSNENTMDYINQSEEQAKRQEEEEKQEEERRQAEEKAKQQEEEKKQAEEQTKQQEEERRRQAEEKAKQQEKEKQQPSINSNENKNNSRTVYTTPSGKRYHYSSQCAGKNARATTKDQAESQGLTPCEKCAK